MRYDMLVKCHKTTPQNKKQPRRVMKTDRNVVELQLDIKLPTSISLD